ncbi:MAG TPA: tRNA pseudouridine(55) synthase TruB, partial [Pseudobdellovibrionaceae bacterium]|nr:tRNA pseudouridine(55) synthase TruB [Pseudobdellovibrionaceae bacterium]
NKSYRAGVRLGVVTDTLDITGETLQEAPVKVGPEDIRKAAFDLQGEFEWEVPLYSAVKVQGKRLHEYAREGAPVERPRKIMKFWDVQMGEIRGSEFEVDLRCSKGSFIRSWIHQLGQNLGCGAAMASLVRTGSMPYELSQAMTLSELENAWKGDPEALPCLIPMTQALPWAKRVKVRGHDRGLLMNGQISHDLRANLITQFRPGQDVLIQIQSDENELLALVGVEPGRGFVLRRVFKPEP